MALFIPGGPAGGAPSGSLGSIVFSKNRFGSYMRTRIVPTNPATADQVLARNRMSDLTNRWLNTLTDLQRQEWATYAANVPVTNRIGQQIFLTGLNWYVASNSLRSQAVVPRSDDAPATFNLAAYTVTGVLASEATQDIAVSFLTADEWLDDDGALLAWATRPQNPTINFNNLPYRFAGAVPGNTATPPTSPATISAPFAFAEGQRLFLRFNVVNPDARIGPVQKLTTIAIA